MFLWSYQQRKLGCPACRLTERKYIMTNSDLDTIIKEDDKLSFSKSVEGKPPAQIAATIQGQSVSYNESRSSTIDDSASSRYSPELLSYASDKQIWKHHSTEDLVSIIKGLIMTMRCHSISSHNSQGCSIAVRKVSGRSCKGVPLNK